MTSSPPCEVFRQPTVLTCVSEGEARHIPPGPQAAPAQGAAGSDEPEREREGSARDWEMEISRAISAAKLVS